MDDKTIEAELEAVAQHLLTPALLADWRSPLKRLPLLLMRRPEYTRLLAIALRGKGKELHDECVIIVGNWLGAPAKKRAKKIGAGNREALPHET